VWSNPLLLSAPDTSYLSATERYKSVANKVLTTNPARKREGNARQILPREKAWKKRRRSDRRNLTENGKVPRSSSGNFRAGWPLNSFQGANKNIGDHLVWWNSRERDRCGHLSELNRRNTPVAAVQRPRQLPMRLEPRPVRLHTELKPLSNSWARTRSVKKVSRRSNKIL